MNQNEFNIHVASILKDIENLLITKGKEYTLDNNDKLCNFKQSALLQHIIPEKVLLGYVSKHIIALFNKVDTLISSNEAMFDYKNVSIKDYNKFHEYIKDIIVYMLLLLALLKERTII